MAAPSSTARGTPAGIHLDDGFSTKITPARASTISFWEKTVKPPGCDGGDPIETSTMHNVTWRTKSPRHLVTLTESTVMAAYDPNLYNTILAILNVPDSWTVLFPDGSTLVFYGFLQKFEPSELKEGEFPEASITICPTNFDPVNKVEAAPVLTSVAGT